MAQTMKFVEVNEYSTAAIEAILDMKDGAVFMAQSGDTEYTFSYEKGAVLELSYTAAIHNEPEELEYAPFEFIQHITNHKITLKHA